jgi:hypothetical protein
MKHASPSSRPRGRSVRAIDTLLAIKVVGLIPDLNASERRVATVLIEHYNRGSGRCDPGLGRIAVLMNASTRTVIRANHKLERIGLFRKVRHGGYGNRNSYEPVWRRFSEYEVAWRAKLKEAAQSRATKLSLARRQSRHVFGDEPVTQTCNNNRLKNETCSKRHPKQRTGNNFLFEPSIVSSGNHSADAAHAEAERRWSSDLLKKFGSTPATYAAMIEAIDPMLASAATEAEMLQRTAGLAFIIKELRRKDAKGGATGCGSVLAPKREANSNTAALRQSGIVLNRSEKKL